MAAKTITLGRDTSNTKVYNKGDISSKHAKITLIGNNEYEVEDLDSTNGTYVNGYRIKKAKISGNEQLRLCLVLNYLSRLCPKRTLLKISLMSLPN